MISPNFGSVLFCCICLKKAIKIWLTLKTKDGTRKLISKLGYFAPRDLPTQQWTITFISRYGYLPKGIRTREDPQKPGEAPHKIIPMKPVWLLRSCCPIKRSRRMKSLLHLGQLLITSTGVVHAFILLKFQLIRHKANRTCRSWMWICFCWWGRRNSARERRWGRVLFPQHLSQIKI